MSDADQTSWTDLGDVSWTTWHRCLTDAASPILGDGLAAYQAARPHTTLALALMLLETRGGTRGAEGHNPFRLPFAGSFPGLATFDSWTAGIAAWRERGIAPLAGLAGPTQAHLRRAVLALKEVDARPPADPLPRDEAPDPAAFLAPHFGPVATTQRVTGGTLYSFDRALVLVWDENLGKTCNLASDPIP